MTLALLYILASSVNIWENRVINKEMSCPKCQTKVDNNNSMNRTTPYKQHHTATHHTTFTHNRLGHTTSILLCEYVYAI